MEFDKDDYIEKYKLEEMEGVLSHIRGLKDHEEEDITKDLFDEYPDYISDDVQQVLFHRTARKKYVTALWKDGFEVINVSRAFSNLEPITLEECVAAFVYEPEAIEDLTHLMD
ncbi:hypothetical protein [Butyrivibrio sp. INlla16]|uniref:hypothetical protein n=1 Tax=Butyrivibrio sp. INlla16 TaxID=1520807 RepID=UPI00088D56DC|nr:hypothetical protein [Butyrivibrio sp. INlla16]SDB51925.1 hypothetical protein SAMN02910263_02617 [Butyrivibrio sp. INlla16]